MATHWEVRQFVRSVAGGRLEVVTRSEFQRIAEANYRTFSVDRPDEYFELVRVEHHEECLAHNGKPDVGPNASSTPK